MFPRIIAAALACAFVAAAAFAPFRAGAQSAAPAAAASPSSEVRFSGEITNGALFEREIGHGLMFRLVPLSGDGPGGWIIEITPQVQAAADPEEFSEIVTPPYHFYNDRYLAGAYGYSTKEAAAKTERDFNFVLSLPDRRIAEEVVNAVLYPSAASEQEKQRIASEAAALNLGHGVFHILKSRVKLGKVDQPDVIAWLKFDVVLDFSPGLTLQAVLAPEPPSNR